MADTSTHFLTYDPDAMWTAMLEAYSDAGGDVLYPGDEKEILLRGVLEIMARAYAAFDHASRMRTLRYAPLEYLILGFGEPRGIPYAYALSAKGRAAFTFAPLTEPVTLMEGERLTRDGVLYYRLAQTLRAPASASGATYEAEIECAEAGEAGNGLVVGTELFPVRAQARLASIVVTQETAGGAEAEDIEAYRERVRTGNLLTLTTGTAEAYRSRAMAVSQHVIDAHTSRDNPGVATVTLLLADGLAEGERDALIKAVYTALSPDNARPVTDHVEVREAAALSYTLSVKYAVPALGADDVRAAITAQVEKYRAWQERTLGRAFDPYNLIGLMYGAGATRAQIDYAESNVDGGATEYTTLEPEQHWRGTIVLEELPS